MFPILIRIGPLTLHTYGLCIALGVIAGTQLLIHWAKRNGIPGTNLSDTFYALSLYALIGGLLGARLLYVITFWDQFAGDWSGILKIWEGGLVFYGGLIGGAAGFLLWKRLHPEIPWLKAADSAAPALAVGHALGRMGCFFAGCCYGRPCDLPWAVTFTRPDALAPLGIPLHPTQIYEVLHLCLLAAYLSLRNARPHRDGAVFADYLTIYAIGRFTIEFFRGDLPVIGVLTPGHVASLIILAAAFVFRFASLRAGSR